MAIRCRRFGEDENQRVCKLFARGFNELLRQAGEAPYVDVDDPAAWALAWERDRRSLFEHLAAGDGERWLAEEDGTILGYARSIVRGGVCQLTEFWVLPEAQNRGIGQKLLERTFRPGLGKRGRTVLATTTGAAVARYLKSGVDVLCVLLGFEQTAPGGTSLSTGVDAEPMAQSRSTIEALNRIDRAVLGFDREVDHAWYLKDREGFLYRRNGQAIGYGYLGRWHGPFAALDPADLPAMLAHGEARVAERGGKMTLEVPLVNSVAVRHLLARGFRMHDKFVQFLMADTPRPSLDRYIIPSPGFFW